MGLLFNLSFTSIPIHQAADWVEKAEKAELLALCWSMHFLFIQPTLSGTHFSLMDGHLDCPLQCVYDSVCVCVCVFPTCHNVHCVNVWKYYVRVSSSSRLSSSAYVCVCVCVIFKLLNSNSHYIAHHNVCMSLRICSSCQLSCVGGCFGRFFLLPKQIFQ